jgi:uncharacterized Zn finger protein
MSWGWGGFGGYTSVADRLERGRREAAKRLKRAGREPAPVVIEGKQLARTFWGKAWNENLERYADLASRLERGRTYARNGSVVDLHVTPGEVAALVAGSDVYTVKVKLGVLDAARWKAIVDECAGKISTLVGLLKGELPAAVLAVLTRQGTGLFPEPREIDMDCTCPDSAGLCKHLAAVLYGVGARLDRAPELFFTLRQVDQAELLAQAGARAVLSKAGSGKKRITPAALGGIFGIELDDGPDAGVVEEPAVVPAKKRKAKATTKKR